MHHHAMLVFLLSLSLLLLSSQSLPSFAERQLSPLLHNQALSHIAFHSNPIKLALASIFSPRTISIVGVEWGEDLILFAENNYTVYAFEPASKFVNHLKSVVHRNPHWNVSLIPIAAGNTSEGTIQLCYDNENVSETVRVGRVDQYVQEPLGVFSLDIQGDELHVLEGSTNLFTSANPPASLWVEAIACNPNVLQILEMLQDQYVFFDFVPWGRQKGHEGKELPLSLQSFVFNPHRPGAFRDFLDWMCEIQKRDFEWLQTDFLVIRRDLLTDQVVASLASLASKHCQKGTGAKCHLRSLLRGKEDGGKEEL